MSIRLVGLTPLLMHSDRGANPLDPAAKEHKKLTSIRKKTDDIYMAIARSEWRLGMYYDEEMGPYLPTWNIRSSIATGGKFHKLGATIERSVMILVDRVPLQYKGPRNIDEMWDARQGDRQRFADCRSVVVGTSRVMRYRPVFSPWTIEFDLSYDETTVQRDQVIQCLDAAGRFSGLGDFRPGTGGGPFGRFKHEVTS